MAPANLPDIAAAIAQGALNPWVYLPAAVALGALHALEPGHSKSVMAAFIISIKGTVGQAVLLGLAAAAGHTLIVWGLVLAGLLLGEKFILATAEPWLILFSGLLIVLLGARLLRGNLFSHHHGHNDHDHSTCNHHHATPEEIKKQYKGKHVSSWNVIWFGFSGGLLPCPSALAVLLVCLQLQKVALGAAMVGAFSLGLALSLVAVGIIAAWGTHHARSKLAGKHPQLEKLATHFPAVSGALVCVLGLVITTRGLIALGWLSF